MKKTYMIPQSRIELVETPEIMQEFLGVATVSGGGAATAPEDVHGA